METKHTAGQWTLKANNPNDLHIRQGDKGKVIAEVCTSGLSSEQEESEANATLIAAAPEMLQVLRKLLDSIKNVNSENSEEYYNAIEVIRKATK